MKTISMLLKVFFLLVLLSACGESERYFLETPEFFVIHVDGAIKQPRKISIHPYATIGDVLEEITLLENSDLSSLNLQTILHHNDKLTIPFTQEEACISINHGTIEQLSSLVQVGPVIAQRIIDYRNTHGLFQTIDEIILVKGIGEKTYQKNKARLCL